MKKFLKIVCIVGLCLTVVGGVIFTVAMGANGWDFNALSNLEYEQKSYTVTADEADGVLIDVSVADVRIVQTDAAEYTLEYFDTYTKKGALVSRFTPSLVGGVLTLKETRNKVHLTVSVYTNTPTITVNIPKSETIALTVDTSTGDITIGETGKTGSYSKLQLETNTGDISILGNTVCSGQAAFTTNTGDMQIGAPLQAQSVRLEADTGDIYCTAAIDTQSVNASTDTGDIVLKLLGSKDGYSYTYETDTGKSNYHAFSGGDKTLRVETDTGDITLSFTE